MIRHGAYTYEQCMVEFNGDIHMAVSQLDEEGQKYPAILLDYREIESQVNLNTIPCILKFKNPEAIDGLIQILSNIKEGIGNG